MTTKVVYVVAYWTGENNSHLAIHTIFDNEEAANRYLLTFPEAMRRQYFVSAQEVFSDPPTWVIVSEVAHAGTVT